MKVWSFYDLGTGRFTGQQFSTTDEGALAANTPPGVGVVEGAHDHLSRCVDLDTGAIVDWQPPRPSDGHEWNEETRRWQLSDAALARFEQQQNARARLQDLEQRQLRAVRELTLDSQNTVARARLAEIDAEIASLRPLL